MQLSLALLVIFELLISTFYVKSLNPLPVSTLSKPLSNSLSHLSATGNVLPVCRDMCGSVAIKYPFGLDDGCGAPEYRNMFNCTGDLFFRTPTGLYRVRSIDYDKNTMVIYDPGMSTCTMLQPRHDFALSEEQYLVIPPSSDSAFVLLNCSIDSPVLNRYRSLCYNFSGHTCDELYNACSSFKMMRLPTGAYQPCCFTDYTTLKFMTMNILDCSHYTTVYGLDDLKGVGPLDWTYGIELSYAVPNSGCDHCQRSGGTCGFNTETEGMLCICSGSTNSTRDCGNGNNHQLCSSLNNSTIDCGNVTAEGHRATPMTLFFTVILSLISVFGPSLKVHV